jgi:hypothetical protein
MSPVPVGLLRLFGGGQVHKMVYISLVVPPIGLDSHMIFAFTRPKSHIPHFTLDSVMAGPHFAFHLDLIPRAILGANLAYMNAVFDQLTPIFNPQVDRVWAQVERLVGAETGAHMREILTNQEVER